MSDLIERADLERDERKNDHPLRPTMPPHDWIMVIFGSGYDEYVPPRYLVDFDVDAEQGLGTATFTLDRAKARGFADVSDVLATWKLQSTVRPLRGDGRPNRPLTTFTISPERRRP